MIIEFISASDEYIEEHEYLGFYKIVINGECVFETYDGESEDNNLYRNFNDIYKLPNIFEKVIAAVKNNENIEIKSYKNGTAEEYNYL